MPHDIRLFSDVSSKMSMFDQRAREHRENQMINPFSEWGGAGTRRKLSKDDPEYGRPVEGSKTAERGRQAQVQMIADMVELCDYIFDCGIRSTDGRAAISFGDLFRLYNSINDKCVGLLMRGRKHKILDFEGEMLFQNRDDDKMIELLLPLNTIRFKYGLTERMGAGEVLKDFLEQQKAADEEARLARAKKQRARSLDHLPTEPSSCQTTSQAEPGWGLAPAPPPERAVSHPDFNVAFGEPCQTKNTKELTENAEGASSANSLFTISEEVAVARSPLVSAEEAQQEEDEAAAERRQPHPAQPPPPPHLQMSVPAVVLTTAPDEEKEEEKAKRAEKHSQQKQQRKTSVDSHNAPRQAAKSRQSMDYHMLPEISPLRPSISAPNLAALVDLT